MLCYCLGEPTLPEVREKEIFRVYLHMRKKGESLDSEYVKEFYAEDEESNGSESPLESTLNYFICEYPDEEITHWSATVYVHWVNDSWREQHSGGHSWGKYKPIRPPYNPAYQGRV